MIDKGLYKKAPAAKSQLVYGSDKRLGYRGDDAARSDRASGRSSGRADPGNAPQGDGPARGGGNNNNQGGGGGGNNNNQGGGGGGADLSTLNTLPPVMTTLPSNISAVDTTLPYNPAGVIASTVPMDIREQYRVGNNISIVPGLGPVTVMDQPYSSLGLEQQRYDNFVDARNLANMEYPGVTGKVPAFIPYSGAINTGINFLSSIIGKPGFEKNTEFFAENVAGKYGYGYGYDDYKEYMKDRMAGKVNAYGRTLTDAEKGGRDDRGIMQVSQVNPLLPIEDDEQDNEENQYDFNYGTASNPIYYSDLV